MMKNILIILPILFYVSVNAYSQATMKTIDPAVVYVYSLTVPSFRARKPMVFLDGKEMAEICPMGRASIGFWSRYPLKGICPIRSQIIETN